MILESAFVELDRVRMSLVGIVNYLNRLVRINIEHDKLLVSSHNNPDLTRSFGVM
jgi:hypothetical protein